MMYVIISVNVTIYIYINTCIHIFKRRHEVYIKWPFLTGIRICYMICDTCVYIYICRTNTKIYMPVYTHWTPQKTDCHSV